MNKGPVLLGVILAFFILTSCASNETVVPKSFPGADKIYSVKNDGTLEVKGYDMKSQPIHWVFVQCAYWSGCYMRCQGPVKTCKNIAKKFNLSVSYIQTNHTK